MVMPENVYLHHTTMTDEEIIAACLDAGYHQADAEFVLDLVRKRITVPDELGGVLP